MLPTVSPRQSVRPGFFLLLLVPLFVVFELYGPTLHVPFQFDDKVLPFAQPQFEQSPLSAWMSGSRPALMFSYWLNSSPYTSDTTAFHAVNITLHFLNSVLAYFVFSCFIQSPRLAAFLAAIFLVHPIQTESVSYIAGRSESLCAFFLLTAYLVFLRRPPGPISWGRSAGVIALYAAAILTKEQAVVLPALLLLTDAFGSPQNVRRNWRLYAPISLMALAGLAMVVRVLSTASTAGFNTRGVTWDQYALTQSRAIFHYLRLLLLPLGQSIDHHFPISRNLLQYHTWLYILALAALAAVAWIYRRRFPLAAFGFFAFLILLAPTSSFIPIADPFAERRLYLPLMALLIAAAEAVRRFRISIPVAVAVLAVFSFFTYQRNQLWSHPIAFWLDTVRTAPEKGRPYSHLAHAAVDEGKCAAVAPVFEEARLRLPDDYYVLTGSAKIMECAGLPGEAAGLLQRAALVRPSAEVFELLGLLYGEMENAAAARQALESAIRLNPHSVSAHLAMGLWYQSTNDFAGAASAYRRVLEIEPFNRSARAALNTISVTRTSSP